MKQYRVKKTSPPYRDPEGRYRRGDWTSYRHVGKAVSQEIYEDVERPYIESALAFLHEQGVEELAVTYPANAGKFRESGVQLQLGETLDFNSLRKVLKSILREEYWAKLEADGAFIHIGWDYYMYVGVPAAACSAKRFAESSGLFLEEFPSPYFEG